MQPEWTGTVGNSLDEPKSVIQHLNKGRVFLNDSVGDVTGSSIGGNPHNIEPPCSSVEPKNTSREADLGLHSPQHGDLHGGVGSVESCQVGSDALQPSSPPELSHAASDQVRSHPRDGSTGRGGTESVDHPGDPEPPGRALRGEGADADEGENSHALASLHGGDQPLQQAQGRPAELPAAAHDDPTDGQRNHQRSAEEGDQEGLRDHTGHGRGPSWVWGAQQPAVLRALGDPAEVCGLGDAHSPGGSVRLPPSPFGGVASGEQGQATDHAQQHQGGQEEAAQSQEWGGERSFLRIQEHVRSRGDAVPDHAADGKHAPAPEGGSGDHQRGASPQEDARDSSLRGGFLHGFLQRGEHGLDPGDVNDPAASVNEFDSCLTYEGNGNSHLDVKDNWESLPEAKARHLSQCSDRLLPEAFGGLSWPSAS